MKQLSGNLSDKSKKTLKMIEFGVQKILDDNENEPADVICEKIGIFFERLQELVDQEEV